MGPLFHSFGIILLALDYVVRHQSWFPRHSHLPFNYGISSLTAGKPIEDMALTNDKRPATVQVGQKDAIRADVVKTPFGRSYGHLSECVRKVGST